MQTRRGVIAGCAGFAVLVAAGPALALTLDEARAAGRVGEMPTGYLGVVDNDPAVRALVDSVNIQRRDHYKAIAERENAPLAAVEQLAGARLIDRAGPGEYVMDVNGKWIRK